MKYAARVSGGDMEVSLEREGLRLGSRFLDFADVAALRPVNHRVMVTALSGEEIEIGMLGFSFDGFWEELMELYGQRSREALFIEEPLIMLTEGEYQTPAERGRGNIALFEDSVCILPQTCHAVRIPLCFAEEIRLDGYELHFTTAAGEHYLAARMGYDTKPFAERAVLAADRVKKARAEALKKNALQPPFSEKGLFRTGRPEQYWLAAFGDGRCAVELFVGEDAATYLYRFSESRERFLRQLEEAMEAMGPHREIIYWTPEQIGEKPLYRMALQRSQAAEFVRARSVGRLIHNAAHARQLEAFLAGS